MATLAAADEDVCSIAGDDDEDDDGKAADGADAAHADDDDGVRVSAMEAVEGDVDMRARPTCACGLHGII
eukprot:6211268-Pyramimonas_sp.AAC.1